MNNKCEMIMDHSPVWSGDGYFCQNCMIEFVPKEALLKRIGEEVEKEFEKFENREDWGKGYWLSAVRMVKDKVCNILTH